MLPISYGLPVGFLERSPTAFCRYVGAEHDGTWWENAAILSTYEVEIFLGIFLNVTGQSTSVAYTHMHFHICRHLCISPKGCYTANPSHCLFGSAAFGLKRKNHLSRFLVFSNYHNTPLCCNELFRMQPALCLLQSAF